MSTDRYKFRGLRVDNNEWVYGYYWYNIQDSKHLIVWSKKLYAMVSGQMQQNAEVIPESVGQYTGLKDKNGNEIYEGDVIKCESPVRNISDNKYTGKIATSYFRIGWHKSGCWNKFYGLSDEHRGITGITLSCLQYYEIIGNIHQNSELIK